MPNVVHKNLDNTTLMLTVTVAREEIQPKFDADLKRFRQKATIKGFRQGQAPASFVKRMYGPSLFSDLVNELISQNLYDYIRDQNFNTLGQPLPVENQKGLSYTSEFEPEYAVSFEVGLVPDFEIKGLESAPAFDYYTVSNLDELAAEDMEYARKRMGKESKPEQDIQENDIVKLASKELEGDEIKEGGWETTITLLMRDVTNPDLKAMLLTKKLHDTIRFNPRDVESTREEAHYRKYILSLPEDDQRAVNDYFEGVIVEVNRMELADLDEAFFESYFGPDVKTETEAFEKLKEGTRAYYEKQADAVLYRDLQKYLLEENKLELPERFLKRWLYVSNEGRFTMAEVEADFENTLRMLSWSLIQDKVMKDNELTVTEEDIREVYRNRIRQYIGSNFPEHLLESTVDRIMADAKDQEEVRLNLVSDKFYNAILPKIRRVEKSLTSTQFHEFLDSLKEDNASTTLSEQAEEAVDA
ncbi:MAG: hypothetical protein KGS48_05625 [Bacteroidetes bacterium]|nr:hypothetical protein [Bacteroidota bacterium]